MFVFARNNLIKNDNSITQRINLFFRNPLAQMEEEKREHDSKMKKMEAEMEQVFEMKVKEKKQKLKDSELELTRRHEERKKVSDKNLSPINSWIFNEQLYFQALELQIRELEERKKAFEHEKVDWEAANGITLEELRRKSLEANSKEWVLLFLCNIFASFMHKNSFNINNSHLHPWVIYLTHFHAKLEYETGIWKN